MKSIKTFNQFNENYLNSTDFINPGKILCDYKVEDLGLSKPEELNIKYKMVNKINSMNYAEKSKVSEELQNLTKRFDCKIEDLTNPLFVKKYLDREIKLRDKQEEFESVHEGFGEYIKEKIIKFLSYVFQIGSTLGSLFLMISSIIDNSFWGVVTGAIALTVSILASAYISSKIKTDK